MGGYRLVLPNEMIEALAYLQIHMEGSTILYDFGPPEKAARFTWRDANLTKEYMKIVNKMDLRIEQV